MTDVVPRLKWVGGAYTRHGLYSVAVKFTASNGRQYGAYKMVRFPSSVRRAVEELTEQMRAVAAAVEEQQ